MQIQIRPIKLLLLLLSLTSSLALAEVRYWCEGAQPLPIEYPHAAPFKLANLSFVSADVSSFGQVELTATRPDNIESYILIIEFLDRDGKHVYSVPIYSTKPGQDGDVDADVLAWIESHPRSSVNHIKASDPTTLQFWIPVVPSSCPTSARLLHVQLRYANGKPFTYAISNLTLDPSIVSAPISSSAEWVTLTPLEFTGRITVDSGGQPNVAQLQPTAPDRRWLQDQVSSWRFSPAVKKGRKVAEDVAFYFVVGTGSFDPLTIERLRIASPTVSVFVFRVVPPAPGGKWELQLANFPLF